MVKTLFFGTPKFAKIILAHLLDSSKLVSELEIVGVVTKLPDKKYSEENNAVFEFAKNKNFSTETHCNVSLLDKYNPELIIVCSYGKILSKEFLDYPKFKAVNIHASLLPSLRGATPIESAILHGLPKTGVTLQVMSEKMDEGDIISQVELDENIDNLNSIELKEKLANLSCELLDKNLIDYIDSKIMPIPQNSFLGESCLSADRSVLFQQNSSGMATYCYTKDFTFEKAEIKFDSKVNIERKIRAFAEIGAWVKNIEIIDIQSRKKYFFEKFVKLNKASLNGDLDSRFGILNNEDLLSNDNVSKESLSLTIINKKLYLNCSNGLLEILELTPEGKNKQSAVEFINGIWNKLK